MCWFFALSDIGRAIGSQSSFNTSSANVVNLQTWCLFEMSKSSPIKEPLSLSPWQSRVQGSIGSRVPAVCLFFFLFFLRGHKQRSPFIWQCVLFSELKAESQHSWNVTLSAEQDADEQVLLSATQCFSVQQLRQGLGWGRGTTTATTMWTVRVSFLKGQKKLIYIRSTLCHWTAADCANKNEQLRRPGPSRLHGQHRHAFTHSPYAPIQMTAH